MSRRVDERAVTVQIGAVLVLAILVSALALYQVTAVPDQNHETEFTHNERVTGELVELRDTIRNAGSERLERGVPMALGTQYQTRTVAINPPAPSGRIATGEPRPVTIENATVDDPAVQSILDDPPETRLLTYDPQYNEYRGPTTRIEHTLLYNDFGAANVTLEEQTTIDDDSVTLVFLEGNLSRSTTGTVSVSVETIGGPTGESTLSSNESGNVTITLPTDSPERWEAAIGTTFAGSPRENARIQPDGDRGNVTIELADETYTLRLAQVRVGDDGEPDERFDAARESGAGSGSGDDAFTTQWSGEAVNTGGGEGGEESELILEEGQHETVDLTVSDVETDDPIANVWVNFARRSGGDGAVSFTGETRTETDANGTASIGVTGDSAGETVLFASTAGGTVPLPVTVVIESESGSVGPSIDSFDVRERPGGNVGIRYGWAVSGGNADLETVVVELYRDETPVDEHEYIVDGRNAQTNNEDFDDLGSGQEYAVRLTVTDENGATAEAAETQVAG